MSIELIGHGIDAIIQKVPHCPSAEARTQRYDRALRAINVTITREQNSVSASTTITIGQINRAIAPLKIDAAGLAALGFEPVAFKQSAKLYRTTDFNRICGALIRHLYRVEAA